jgi:hypothetical protein
MEVSFFWLLVDIQLTQVSSNVFIHVHERNESSIGALLPTMIGSVATGFCITLFYLHSRSSFWWAPKSHDHINNLLPWKAGRVTIHIGLVQSLHQLY